MAVQLTPGDAEKNIGDIEAARDRAVAKLQKISDTQHVMLSSGWQGDSATHYGNTSNEHNEVFHGIINQLNHIVELGSTHMRSVSSTDGNS
jgi:uncharacterized protein YukE